jgi:hypothetical protein
MIIIFQFSLRWCREQNFQGLMFVVVLFSSFPVEAKAAKIM